MLLVDSVISPLHGEDLSRGLIVVGEGMVDMLDKDHKSNNYWNQTDRNLLDRKEMDPHEPAIL